MENDKDPMDVESLLVLQSALKQLTPYIIRTAKQLMALYLHTRYLKEVHENL